MGTRRTRSFLSKQYCRNESRNDTVSKPMAIFSTLALGVDRVDTRLSVQEEFRVVALICENRTPADETWRCKSRARFH
jgi:hypothetical protein